MSEQKPQSHVRIFGIAIRRTTLMRIQGAVFTVLGLGWLAESLLLDQPLGWWQVVKVFLGVFCTVIGLLLLFARVVDTNGG